MEKVYYTHNEMIEFFQRIHDNDFYYTNDNGKGYGGASGFQHFIKEYGGYKKVLNLYNKYHSNFGISLIDNPILERLITGITF